METYNTIRLRELLNPSKTNLQKNNDYGTGHPAKHKIMKLSTISSTTE